MIGPILIEKLTKKAPTVLDLTVHQGSKKLEVKFAGGECFEIAFELMRIYSPSAEVQGHGPGQEVLQTGKRGVGMMGLEPVGGTPAEYQRKLQDERKRWAPLIAPAATTLSEMATVP